VFREVLREAGLKECVEKVDDHIYEKRRPVAEYKKMLGQSHFHINGLYEDEFDFKFSDATAMLNHFSMKIFMASWKELVPIEFRENVFKNIEQKLNMVAERRHGLSMNVPFVTIDSQNAKG
jgi:hypothetical protein